MLRVGVIRRKAMPRVLINRVVHSGCRVTVHSAQGNQSLPLNIYYGTIVCCLLHTLVEIIQQAMRNCVVSYQRRCCWNALIEYATGKSIKPGCIIFI